jgi:DNA-binding NtrC family response regulator
MMSEVRILVVDDDQGCRDVFREILSRNHYPFQMVETTEEALTSISDGTFDIIFTDILGVDGLYLLKRCKDQNPDAEVIVFSGDIRNKAHSLEAGASCFIAKPFTVREVIAVTREVMERVMKRKTAGQ